MGLSPTVSEINDFSRNGKIVPPRVFCAPADGVPLGIVYRRSGSKKLQRLGYRAEEEVWRYLQPSGYNTPTWRTDRRTDTGRQQRPRLRITSRGKKFNRMSLVTHPIVLKISSLFADNFFCYPANKQTDTGKHITSLAEITKHALNSTNYELSVVLCTPK